MRGWFTIAPKIMTHSEWIPATSPLFKIPFSLCASGPSGCGKSFWVKNLLLHSHLYCEGSWNRIFYFSRFQLRSLEKELRHLPIEFFEGETLPTLQELRGRSIAGEQVLVVVDDMMEQAAGSSFIRSLFTEGRHIQHSIILTSQNLFHPGKYAVAMRQNTTYMLLF